MHHNGGMSVQKQGFEVDPAVNSAVNSAVNAVAERLTVPFRPDFLVIGAQKSGTTSLAQALRRHPELFIPGTKEAKHFGSVPDEAVAGEQYRDFFSGWSGERLIGEATPEYLFLPAAARQIVKFVPDAKLIAVLRNPVDRLYSAYWHARRVGQVYPTFESFLDDQISARGTELPMVGNNIIYGHYVYHLQRYFDLGVDPSKLLVLLFDDLVGEPAETLLTVQEFLGVRPLLKRVPQANSNQESMVPPAVRRILWRIKQVNPSLGVRMSRRTNRVREAPPMNRFTRMGLVEYYRPYNNALATLIGRDLSEWNR